MRTAVPVTSGFFEYQPGVAEAFALPQRHPGAIVGVDNVKNIRLDGPQFSTPASPVPVTWQAVRFDADVVFAQRPNPRLVIAGGSASGRVPSRDITGWIQIDGPTYTDLMPDGTPIPRVHPATAANIADPLVLKGPVHLDRVRINLGGTPAEPRLAFRAVRRRKYPALNGPLSPGGVRRCGSPALPRDGAWAPARPADAAPTRSIRRSRCLGSPAPRCPVPAAGTSPTRSISRCSPTPPPATRTASYSRSARRRCSTGHAWATTRPITPPAPSADMGAPLHRWCLPGLGDAFDFQVLKALW